MKRIAQRIASLFAAIFIVVSLLATSAPAAAISVEPQPDTTTTSPDILITSIVGSASLEDLEIYNQSAAPIKLAGWSFSFTVKDSGSCSGGKAAHVMFPDGWLLSKNYFTFFSGSNSGKLGEFSVDSGFLADCSVSPWLSSIRILQGAMVEQTVTIPDPTTLQPEIDSSTNPPTYIYKIAQQHQRNNSANSTRTLSGDFASDYKVASIIANASDPNDNTTLYSDPLYSPPSNAGGLEIVEILPNTLSCSPLDTSLDCSDYIKLFNASGGPIDLSAFRVRTNYDGTKSTASNTISLSGTLTAGAYTIVNTKNDGSPLSLTDSGGYVWLEDAYGVQTYQPIVQYPSASSTTKIGQAWALNGSTWQWTAEPTLQANSFPPTPPASVNPSTSVTYAPCRADQYRNSQTHRCRDIVSATSSLVPCNANQERNPATNRCDDISLASASSLKPCQAGDERNPATNRCRSVLGASTTLQPCAAGQTRNPATNRCRKSVVGSLANIQDIKTAASPSNNHWRWIIAAAAVLAAFAYALYEWRHELAIIIQKFKAKPGRKI